MNSLIPHLSYSISLLSIILYRVLGSKCSTLIIISYTMLSMFAISSTELLWSVCSHALFCLPDTDMFLTPQQIIDVDPAFLMSDFPVNDDTAGMMQEVRHIFSSRFHTGYVSLDGLIALLKAMGFLNTTFTRGRCVWWIEWRDGGCREVCVCGLRWW